MKKHQILAILALCLLNFKETLQDNLEYNFEIQNGKNTLVVSKDDPKSQKKQIRAKNNHHHLKKSSKKKEKSTSGDNLSKMVKLGVLIDRITDRLEKDSKKSKKKTSLSNSKKDKKKARKAFLGDMGTGGSVAALAGGAAVAGVGAGMMAGAADNAQLEADIDMLKMKQTNLYITDRLGEECLTWLHKSNRGFAVLKVKASVLLSNFNQKFGIVFDHLNTMLDDMETDYDNIGVKPKS
jgi:hypothetical protein